MQWPLPEGWDEKQIEEAVFGKQRSIEESSARAFADFPAPPTAPAAPSTLGMFHPVLT
jgi:hypothetical protein